MRCVVWIGAVVLASACAPTSWYVPTEAIVDARATVREAEAMGAARDPQAALYLALANHHIASADAAIAVGDDATAKTLLERAQLDAELASALVDESRARTRASAARQEVDEQTQVSTEVSP